MEKFSLKWNDFQTSVTTSFKIARSEVDLCDITLVSDDEVSIKAHKFVLSSSSSFFKQILLNNPHQHPLLYLSGLNSTNLNFILDYIYQGEVQLFQDQLDNFLNAAQVLKIEGLLSNDNDDNQNIEVPTSFSTKSKGTFKARQNFQQVQNMNDSIEPDYKQESKMENVGVITTIDSADSDEIKAKVREFLEKKDGKYVCKVCYKSSSDSGNLLRHIETHIDGLSYNCQHCAKTFRSVNSLSKHKSVYHKNIKL